MTNPQPQAPVYKENRGSNNFSNVLERTANKTNLSNTGLSSFSNFNSNDYSSNLNTTLISNSNTNTNKKSIPLPINKSIIQNNKSNSSSVVETRYNCKSTKNNGNCPSL